MHTVRIEVKGRYIPLIFDVLRHEETPTSKINYMIDDNTLIFECEAETISNLRAICNTFIKWVDMIEQIAKKSDGVL